MTHYLMSVYPDYDLEATISDEERAKLHEDVDRFNEKVQGAGAWVFAGGLHEPATATVVRSEGGEVLTTDGPFAEAKEQVGGFWIIETADLDEALHWAAQATVACQAPVEVRPFEGVVD